MKLPKVAISIGDLNGVGIEIALKSHEEISKYCIPTYCINKTLLNQASKLLNREIPNDFSVHEVNGAFDIEVGKVSKDSGQYSYDSFLSAIELAQTKNVDAIVTMPIHKEAWQLAGLEFVGHTDVLRKHFVKDAIMMLGCEKMYVALFTEHIPLKEVTGSIEEKKLTQFLLDLYDSLKDDNIAVLGVNPHAGDNGVLGDEETIIIQAIKNANTTLKKDVFKGPLVPDIAFTPHVRKNFKHFVAMYHDQGLGPLKALYFDESINVSLNLPIIRTSVDHGTAFDIAYEGKANNLSYLNAVQAALNLL